MGLRWTKSGCVGSGAAEEGEGAEGEGAKAAGSGRAGEETAEDGEEGTREAGEGEEAVDEVSESWSRESSDSSASQSSFDSAFTRGAWRLLVPSSWRVRGGWPLGACGRDSSFEGAGLKRRASCFCSPGLLPFPDSALTRGLMVPSSGIGGRAGMPMGAEAVEERD